MHFTQLHGPIIAIAVAGAVAGAGGPAAAAHTLNGARHEEHNRHEWHDRHERHRDFNQVKLRHGELKVRGTRGDDSIALRLKAGDPSILQVDLNDDGTADASVRRASVQQIVVKGRAGDDHLRIDESNGIFTDTIPTTLDGGDGNDTISGGSGAETLFGGDGNDTIEGNRGNDAAFLGAGDDTFVWDPGDGSDVVEGQDGTDTMRFNGSNAAEHFDLSANGNRLRFFRDVGNITMDTAGVERVDVNALGGEDVVTVNDLSGTDVTDVNADLGTAAGLGDGSTDRVIVNGTNHDDTITTSGDASGVSVSGLAPHVSIVHQEPTDALNVNALDGNDVILADGLAPGAISPTFDAGAGNDRVSGSPGFDRIVGGDGNDTIDGHRGNDEAFLGAGDDTFVWDPGDGSDLVEGDAGVDTLRFNGANIAEKFDLSANGNRLRLFRDVGNVTMDVAGVEHVDVNALGGADTVTVNDLTGTDVTNVNVDLAGNPGSGDGAADQVIATGTDGSDNIKVAGNAAGINVTGLAAAISVANAEAANDRLDINTLGGKADTVDSSGLAKGQIQLFVDGALVP